MYATLAAILLMFLGFVYPKMSRPADILRSVLWAVLLAGAGAHHGMRGDWFWFTVSGFLLLYWVARLISLADNEPERVTE